VHTAAKAECGGLCSHPQLNLWHHSILQSADGKFKKKRERGKKRTLRSSGGSGRPGLSLVIKRNSVWAGSVFAAD